MASSRTSGWYQQQLTCLASVMLSYPRGMPRDAKSASGSNAVVLLKMEASASA